MCSRTLYRTSPLRFHLEKKTYTAYTHTLHTHEDYIHTYSAWSVSPEGGSNIFLRNVGPYVQVHTVNEISDSHCGKYEDELLPGRSAA